MRTAQSISSPCFFFSHSLASLKWPFPRKPRWAERGEGCADLRQKIISWTSSPNKARDDRTLIPDAFPTQTESVFQKEAGLLARTSSTPSLLNLFCAGKPQAKNTTPLPSGRSSTARMTASVKVSQPFFECELALCARTVKQVFNQRTPAFARGVRSLRNSVSSSPG